MIVASYPTTYGLLYSTPTTIAVTRNLRQCIFHAKSARSNENSPQQLCLTVCHSVVLELFTKVTKYAEKWLKVHKLFINSDAPLRAKIA
ncbi:hypothetical protein KNV05_gp100 [Vibrio phage River4]|uniref:Uncharacterized protein n=1 Tax=Vibrio phage River4 TaxID=2736288 RepID=A0A6M9Z0B5_9CAUD|nr:hypothetical protein KNV05_gp012 [Vibrio phage River4]YP_010108041.1 hypothetical protein KNV05_gp100 [Vibrio phage River4]QKN84674.1 hypothetical protein RIVER4_12 [Vibrio phage River4]QKN84855.1 hypothetical protein RIVER4_216 [Vibrio phage River4]